MSWRTITLACLCVPCLALALTIPEDTVRTTAGRNHFSVVNPGASAVTVDSIHFSGATAFQLFLDTVYHAQTTFYGDLWLSPQPLSATLCRVVNPGLSIRPRDTLDVYDLELGDCWGCLAAEAKAASIPVQLTVTFYGNDHTRDSVVVFTNHLQGTGIREARRPAASSRPLVSGEQSYLVSGRRLPQVGIRAEAGKASAVRVKGQ